MHFLADWPIWLVVTACGTLGQLIKLVVYSTTKRHFDRGNAAADGCARLPTDLP